ncbi:MAG TPA: asparagine synthase-related protein, partial [Dehalococcoidia bacterium]|nr:asparagine synthase-related protein [Dehalococcoidia bacterium]
RELLEGHGRSPLPTISAVWERTPEADERPYINAVLRGGGVAPIIIQAEDLNPLADIDAILACQDEMFYGPNIFLAWELHRAARDAGVAVLLNGLHGDYAISHGVSYLSELTRRGRWLRAAREANGLSRRVYGNKYSAGQVFWHRGVKPNIPEWLQRRPFRQHRYPLPSTAALVNREVARRTFLEERYQALIEERGGSTRSAREEQWKDLTSGFISYNLELAGHVAAAFVVEARYPFCDRRLVELCLALPGDQRLRGGWSRMIVRRAMAGTLPEEVRWREGKADINPHFARTLIARERRALDETVARPGAIDTFVDRRALAQVYDRYLQNNEDYSAAAVVWSAHVMTRWLEQTEFRMPEMVGRGSV